MPIVRKIVSVIVAAAMCAVAFGGICYSAVYVTAGIAGFFSTVGMFAACVAVECVLFDFWVGIQPKKKREKIYKLYH